jgi:hypothetical protein
MLSRVSFDRTGSRVSYVLRRTNDPLKRLTLTFRSRHLMQDSNCRGCGFFFDELDSELCCGDCDWDGWGAEGP